MVCPPPRGRPIIYLLYDGGMRIDSCATRVHAARARYVGLNHSLASLPRTQPGEKSFLPSFFLSLKSFLFFPLPRACSFWLSRPPPPFPALSLAHTFCICTSITCMDTQYIILISMQPSGSRQSDLFVATNSSHLPRCRALTRSHSKRGCGKCRVCVGCSTFAVYTATCEDYGGAAHGVGCAF